MEPVSMVVAALLAGAAAGATKAATSAVVDAYQGLKDLLRRRLASHDPDTAVVVDRDNTEPQVWEAELVPVLNDAGIGHDDRVLEAARRVLALVDPAGTKASKYQVDLREAKGVQVGDHNTQHNTF
jgi:hypothetical protein